MLALSNLLVQTSFAQRKKGPKIFWVVQNLKFRVKKAAIKKSCGFKKNKVQRQFGTNFLGSKKFGQEKVLAPKIQKTRKKLKFVGSK